MNINIGAISKAAGAHVDAVRYREAVAAGKLDIVGEWLRDSGYDDRGRVDWVKLRALCLLFVNRMDRRGVYLHGPPGTGKTRLARLLAGVCNEAWRWRDCDKVALGYDPNNPVATQSIGSRDALGERLEIYDELGNERKGAYGVEIMPPIIQNRYRMWERYGYRTIWISNHDPASGRLDHYGSHIVDRLRGMSMILPFSGESLR